MYDVEVVEGLLVCVVFGVACVLGSCWVVYVGGVGVCSVWGWWWVGVCVGRCGVGMVGGYGCRRGVCMGVYVWCMWCVYVC